MEAVTSRDFWKDQIRTYMVNNKLTLKEMSEQTEIAYNKLLSILYDTRKQKVSCKTIGILMPIWEKNKGGENK